MLNILYFHKGVTDTYMLFCFICKVIQSLKTNKKNVIIVGWFTVLCWDIITKLYGKGFCSLSNENHNTEYSLNYAEATSVSMAILRCVSR